MILGAWRSKGPQMKRDTSRGHFAALHVEHLVLSMTKQAEMVRKTIVNDKEKLTADDIKRLRQIQSDIKATLAHV